MTTDLRDALEFEDLLRDPLLTRVPVVEGYKVLHPCVLYARIGHGSTSVVYRGRHLKLDIDVAIKCLLPERFLGGNEFLKRFQREASIAASVSHQNLIRVFEINENCGLHYLVLEHVEGETLKQRVDRVGKLPVAEALSVVLGAARGVAAAHREEVIHRDVKPDNILLANTGGIKVTDLGIARSQDSQENLTVPCLTVGTPKYMSPEHWQGLSMVGPAGDVWALGATLYFALTGEHPFAGSVDDIMRKVTTGSFPDVRARRPDIPGNVAEVLGRCTQKQPSHRYADASELASALESVDLGYPMEKAKPEQPEATQKTAHSMGDFSLPEETLKRIQRAASGDKSSAAAGAKVLIVEDDRSISLALAVRLKSLGLKVLQAHDGLQAVSVAVKHVPDLILMDISMPAGDGLTVARRLLDLVDTSNVPVIFMTARKDPELREKALELGAVAFFEKPFETQEIIDEIEWNLARSQNQPDRL